MEDGGVVNPFPPGITAADTANLEAGAGESLLTRAGRFTFTAATSGLQSIYNTAAYWSGNSDSMIDTAKWLDTNDAEMGAYYKNNKQLTDTAGFIAGSFIPGTLAVKGLNLLKVGAALGPFSRALGFAQSQQLKYVGQGLSALAENGGTLFNQITKAKLAATGWAVADQAINAAAFETAVAVTMKQNPLLEKDTWYDVAKNGAMNAAAFGALGGGLEYFAIRSVFKEGGKTIDKALRDYTDVTHLEGNLPEGDKAYALLNSMLDLPAAGRNVEFNYRLAGQDVSTDLPLKDVLERTVADTQRNAWLTFKTYATKMADGDGDLGNAFSIYVQRHVDEMQQGGKSVDDIKERLYDILGNVGKIRRPNAETASKDTSDLFYLAKEIPQEAASKVGSVDDLLKLLSSRSPTGSDVSKYPYQFIGQDLNTLKVGRILGFEEEAGKVPGFHQLKDAWEGQMDAVVLRDGTLRINPDSPNFKTTTDPILQPRSFFDLHTGSFAPVAFPTIADVATAQRPMAIVGNRATVIAGEHTIPLKSFDLFDIDPVHSIETSARYAWAAAKDKGGRYLTNIPDEVASTDFPLLERIYQEGADKYKHVKIKEDVDGPVKSVAEITNFSEWLTEQKLGAFQQFLDANKKGTDLGAMAIKLNVSQDWLERAITTNFISTPELNTAGNSIPLSAALYPKNLEIRWDFSIQAKLKQELLGLKKAPKDVMIQTLPFGANNTIYGELGWQYKAKVARDQYESAAASVLGADVFARLMEFDPDMARMLADQQGSGPTMFSASNASYGDPLRLWTQYTGVVVDDVSKKRVGAALDYLKAYASSIRDDKNAASELGTLMTALRRTNDKFVTAAAPVGQISREAGHEEKFVSQLLLNRDAATFDKESGAWIYDAAKAAELKAQGRTPFYSLQNQNVAEFMQASQDLNAKRIDQKRVLMASKGFNYNYDSSNIYVPPVDTGRYPFFAFVRKKTEFLAASSDVSMITARDAQSLRVMTGKVPEDYEVIFNDGTKNFHKAKADYDYSLSIKEPTVDTALQRAGVLGDFFPEARAENILDDFVRWHSNQETRLVRDAVETRYAQSFTELRALGQQYEESATSKFSGALKKFKSEVENPFNDYIKTALNISRRSEYTLLQEANEFTEALGTSAYKIFERNREKAMSGSVTWEEANRTAERFGLKGPYTDAEIFYQANKPEERSLIKDFVAKANMTLVNLTLRLDHAASLVNIISTPILLATEVQSIKSLAAKDSELAGVFAQLRSVAVPGTGGQVAVPSTMKLLGGAIADFFGPEKAGLLQRYQDLGAIKGVLSQYHDMMDWLSIKPYSPVSKLKEASDKALEIGAKITGNTWAEEFTRFVSARVMHVMTDPFVEKGALSFAEQNAYISSFVNRVQGNYLSSQRPIAFQGVLGSAISLFQTYQFNMLQQLFRHIENRDTKALAVMGGLQGGLYGLNGIPFFEAVNTHLLGNSTLNPEHRDVYSQTPNLLGKEFGDWLMYGTASAFPFFSSKAPALYTRGDINPRHISIIPVSPLDVPAVDGSIRVVSNLINFGQKALGGADISSALLEALEHNSISRPLAGFAQVVQGYSTTSQGSLIAANNDMFSIATLSRLIGAKPIDESLALNAKFRQASYQAADDARINTLGEVVKTKLRKNQLPTTDELNSFQLDYAKAGGRIENYTKALQRWSRDANVSTINALANQHRSTYGQRMMEIMGGVNLPDFRNQAASSVTAPSSALEPEQAVSPVASAEP